MNPPTLFDVSLAEALANHPGRVRRTDPVTSQEAAKRVGPRVGSQKAAVLLALAAEGPNGLTDWELAQRCGLVERRWVAGTRRGDLTALGMVEATDRKRPTDSGSPAVVHRITDAGRWIADELRRAAQQ